MKILVSACLLGVNCRYNGVCVVTPEVLELAKEHTLIPVCPEQLGGLPTPREPSERLGERVVTRSGLDVTREYARGAEETARLCRLCGCDAAILKEHSPSCGSGEVYDGSFTHTVVPRDGVTAELLKKRGVPVYGESEVEKLKDK